MKKYIAVITESELSKLEDLQAIVATYKSLLNNRYMKEEEKEEVSKHLHLLVDRLNDHVLQLAEKYRIPKSIRENMMIAYNEKSLFVEV